MIDEKLAARQICQLSECIVTHRMMNQKQIAFGGTQILQLSDPPGQRGIHVFHENIGLKSEPLQHRLHKEHAICDGISNRRA